MMEEPEGPRPTGRFTPLLLDRMGVEELRAYIEILRGEIERAEREIGKREAQKKAAEGFFRVRE